MGKAPLTYKVRFVKIAQKVHIIWATFAQKFIAKIF